MGLEIARIILFSEDVARLVAFYRDVIGLEVRPGGNEDFQELLAGGCRIAIHKGKGPDKERNGPKLVFGTEDVAATRAELVQRGATMGKVMVFSDLHLCDGRDLDGNPLQLSNRP